MDTAHAEEVGRPRSGRAPLGWAGPLASWVTGRYAAAFGAILVVALAVRVGYVLATPGYRAVYDGGDYLRIALSLVHTHHFPGSVYTTGASALRPPLYPMFLAAVLAVTGDSLTAVRLAQAALGTVAVALIGVVAAQLWGRRPALLAVGASAVLPSLVVMGGTIMSESLFVPLMAAALAAALNARRAGEARRAGRLGWSAAAGALAGLATLSRPNGAVLVVGLALLVPCRFRRRGRAAATEIACVVLAAVVVVSPWTVRNAVTFHALIPVADSTGFNLAGTYNATQESAPQPRTAAWSYPPVLPEFSAAFSDRNQSEYRLMESLQTAGVRYAVHHPLYVVEVTALNTWRILGGQPGYWLRLSGQAVGVGRYSEDAWFVGWLVLAALGLAGMATAAVRGAPKALWIAPVLMLVSSAQVDGEARYRTPVEVFVVLIASAGLAAGWRRLERGRRGRPRPAPADR